MTPTLRADRVVLISSLYRQLKPGDIVMFKHNGLEKIKRVREVDGERVFVVGDNLGQSTDSRTFGWIAREAIVGKLIWPRRTNQKPRQEGGAA